MDPKDVKTAVQAVEDVCSLPPDAIKPLGLQEDEHEDCADAFARCYQRWSD